MARSHSGHTCAGALLILSGAVGLLLAHAGSRAEACGEAARWAVASGMASAGLLVAHFAMVVAGLCVDASWRGNVALFAAATLMHVNVLTVADARTCDAAALLKLLAGVEIGLYISAGVLLLMRITR